MRTGKQYLESLRDGRKVYVGGELIEDITTHPMTKGYANAIARILRSASRSEEPGNRDVRRQGRQAPVDALVPAALQGGRNPPSQVHGFPVSAFQGRHLHAAAGRHERGHVHPGRRPEALGGRIPLQGRDTAISRATSSGNGTRSPSKDLAISPMFLDVQFDRGRDDAMAETPMLKILEERDDGILVRGWKAIGTSVPFVNHLLIGNLWRPGQTPEQTVYALVPIATKGISRRRAQVQCRTGRRSVRSSARHDRRRTRCDGLFRRRADSLVAGSARRQSGSRQVVPAAPVRLGASGNPNSALRARRTDGRSRRCSSRSRSARVPARWCRRNSQNSSAFARPVAPS